MSKIRSKGNKSTELKLRMALVRHGFTGWTLHATGVLGKPDFWFARERVAVFVDGCFWHGCQRTKCRRSPQQNRQYWMEKVGRNSRRAKFVTRMLRKDRCQVLRLWEHSLTNDAGLQRAISKILAALQASGM